MLATSVLLHHEGKNGCHFCFAGGETEVSVSENCGQDLKMVGLSLKLLCSCLTELSKADQIMPIAQMGRQRLVPGHVFCAVISPPMERDISIASLWGDGAVEFSRSPE